jgi:hypothetical protein
MRPSLAGPGLAAFMLGACILSTGHRVEPLGGPDGGAGVIVTSPATAKAGTMRKRVVSKQKPDTLVAEDGTTCRVSPERYRDVEIGRDELCTWQ